MLKKNIIADLQLLKERPLLLLYLLAPVLISIILKLIYPLIASQLESLFSLAPENWLALTLITIISSIPILTGAVFAFTQSSVNRYSEVYADNLKSILSGSLKTFIITFSLVFLSGIITDPVTSEGWLRLIYVSLLFSVFSIYIFLVLNRYLNKVKHINIYILSSFFLVCVPFGLLTSTPWQYIAFMSPLYWINWAWIFPDIIESILAGMFAIVFIGGAMSPLMLILYRKRPR